MSIWFDDMHFKLLRTVLFVLLFCFTVSLLRAHSDSLVQIIKLKELSPKKNKEELQSLYLQLIKNSTSNQNNILDSTFNKYRFLSDSDSNLYKGYSAVMYKFYLLNNDNKTVEYSSKLLEELAHLPIARHRAYTNFGIAKHNELNYKEALPFLYKAWIETKNHPELYKKQNTTGMNYAGVLSDFGLVDSAKAIYHQVLTEGYKENADPELKSIILANIGSSYYETNFDSSIKYYHLAALGFKDFKDTINYALCIYNIGYLSSQLHHFDKAKKHLNHALNLYDSINHKNMHTSIYTSLAIIEAKFGNVKKAFTYQNLAAEFLEKAISKAGSEATAEAQAKFNIAEKEYKNQLLSSEMKSVKAQNRIQQTIVTFALVILLVVVIFTLQIQRKRRNIQNLNISLSQKNQSLDELVLEKDNLMQILVHDIRSPIAGVNSAANILKQSKNDPTFEVNNELVDELILSSNSGLKLINSIWEVYEVENSNSIKTDKIDLTKLLSSFVEEHKAIAQSRNINIELMCQDNFTMSNENYLVIVLRNLLLNALKFSPSNSTISVSNYLNNNVAFISIKDQGPGFSEPDKKKMFKKFSKLSAKPLHGDKSSGLGLYLVSVICKKLNINLILNPKYNDGAEFILELPN